MPSLSRRFFNANIAMSKRVEPFFPQHNSNLERQFEKDLHHYLDTIEQPTVLDVGGGRSRRLLRLLNRRGATRVIVVDISPKELALNNETTLKVCADASRGLPFADNCADVVTSRFLIEHLEDTQRFVAESARVAAPQGRVFHLAAAPYTPFAVLGRRLPLKWSRKLIARIYPAQVGILGYPVHYDSCSFKAFTKVLREYGFSLETAACSYHQSAYLYACFPLFLLSACYDACAHLLGVRALCAAFYVQASAAKAGDNEP